MYAEIFAKSEENEASTSKTTWFNTGSKLPTLELMATKPTHLGSPSWHIQLRASEWRQLSGGERGGDMRGYNYTFELQLTPADLVALVNFAMSNKLIKVTSIERSLKRK